MVEIDENTNKKIQELQILEQNFQNVLMQKQSLQIELSEIDTALSEVQKSKGDIFRVLGQVMIKSTKEEVKKDLNEKKESLSSRISLIEKQEQSLREIIERIKGEVINKLQ
ncbi:MAG: prefoldin subunit [Candidatus Pacearchaeota archaeon]